MSALLLDREQTAAALDPVALLPLIRRALVAVSDGVASVPTRIAASSGHGLLGAMPAFVPGLGLAAKLVTIFHLPGGDSSHRGIVLLADEVDGHPLAVMDAEPLTAVRTAATATVAMLALARPDPQRIAVIGAGAQGRAQLALLAATGSPAAVTVVSRRSERARSAAAEHPGVVAVESIPEAVEGADVVFCCTDAAEPVLRADWLAPGAHISSVGGTQGPELPPDLIAGGSVFVEWSGAVTAPLPAGAHELQGMDPDRVTLLGAVLSGRTPGRRDPDELTVFKSTGQGALDVAAAVAVVRRARELGLGTSFDV